jgi:glycosyltransferase involved in cell wall biosynthesis
MTADAVGGVWSYALDLCRALAAHHIRVTLATMGPRPSGAQLACARAIPRLQIVTGDFRLEWMDEPWADVATAGDWLLEMEHRIEPDLVHLNGFAHAALPFTAPVLAVGHSCLSSWADAIPGAIDPAKLDAYREHARHGLQHADYVVAPSAAMLASLQQHYGPLSRAAVIHNGRSSEPFRPADKQPIVLTAGRLWDRAKNIEAVAAVASRLPWPVFVAGDGITGDGKANGNTDEKAIAEPDSNTHVLGRLDEASLATWLGRASIFVLPARYEPFGLLPLEAALSGCALVLGDIPSLREVWGDAADYVDPDDRDGLRLALTRLIESPVRAARAHAAWTRAQAYSVERMAAAYRACYADLRVEALRVEANRNAGVTCVS